MTQDPLDGTQRYTIAIHDGCAGMSQWVKPEIANTSFLAQSFHQLFSVTIRPFHKPTMLSAPVPVPENPWLVRIAVFVPSGKNLIQLVGHWYPPGRQMPALLFASV